MKWRFSWLRVAETLDVRVASQRHTTKPSNGSRRKGKSGIGRKKGNNSGLDVNPTVPGCTGLEGPLVGGKRFLSAPLPERKE